VFKCIQTNQLRKRLAKYLIAGSVLLLPVHNAFAAPNLVLTSSFSPAGGVARTYMDIGGTWDGTNEVTTGDGFTLIITNSGADAAYDIRDIPVAVPAGFILASGSVVVSDSDPGPTCPNMSASASQSGGAGGLVTINIASNNSTEINPGCSYEYTFRLSTDVATTPGSKSLGYDVSYNTVNNDNASVDTVSATQNITVNAGAISLSKTTLESNPPNNTLVDFDVEIQNTGSGGLFAVSLSDVLGDGLTNLDINPPGSPSGTVISGSEYRFDYIAAGQTVNVNVQAETNYPLASTTCPTLENTASIDDRTSIVVPDSSASIPFDLGALSIAHLNASRCVLCGTGTVTLRLTNASGVDVNNLVITEDLLASELMIVGVSTFDGAAVAPSRSGTEYTWTLPAAVVPANDFVDLVFNVTYDTATFGANEEKLTSNFTNISARVDYELSCGITQPAATQNNYPLALDEPLPQVTKRARNVDAGQTAYAPAAFGHVDDDVIWRVRVNNTGPINMQDVVLNDSITGGNFDINYICPTAATANSVATGGSTAGCTSAGGGVVTAVNDFLMNDPFGVAGDDDVNATTFADIFYVGKITSSCGVATNTNSIEWGCDADGPAAGGISSSDVAGTVDTATATLSTQGNGALSASSITHTITGVDGGAEVGSRGIVTIRVQNDTGGTIRGVVIDDLLPTKYVVDTTAPIDFLFEPAYGITYGGAADEMTHNIDLDLADILTNTDLQFTITSNGDFGNDNTRDVDLFRHGDVFTITYEIVLIDKVHFDKAADIDRTPEDATDTTIAPIVPTDPDNTFTINNELTITYDDTCTFTAGQVYTENPQFTVDVEDLDVTMSSVIYVLTNTATVDLQVNVTNNGGHNAQDYFIYVALGDAMSVVTPAPGCNLVTPSIPLPRPEWNSPDGIFNYQTVYVCSDTTGMGTINAGASASLVFTVEKDDAAANDDLTFRADVIGEITLSDGTALTDLDGATSTALDLDSITTSTSPVKSITPVVNNYTHDAFRSRVIGFNLTKVRSSDLCSEDGNVPVSGDTSIIIGEECNYDIKAGGWFGFDTPGFALIAVKDVTLRDDLPNGQGYIDHSTTIIGGTTPADDGIIFEPVPGDFSKIAPDTGAGTALNETDIEWAFNVVGEGSPGITKKDKWFETTVRTRLLNDAVDDSAAGPNTHAATSRDTARASFIAQFDTGTGTVDIPVSENEMPPIPGFPVIGVRQVDMTVTEPNIIITKQVCNETLAAAASQDCIANNRFADEVDDGDTNDSYIYRVTLMNEASGGSPVTARAPAYNVISTDTLGSGISDLMAILDFETDGLDNDGDGVADGADAANEGALWDSIPDKAVGNGAPAVITVDENYNAKLLRVDPGAANSITFYYRVDPDDAIAPLQKLTNTVSMSYDSLDGDYGNQSVPQINNAGTPTAGRARIYTTADAIADVIMIPLEALPKAIITTSNTPLGGSPQNVVIGEEIRYQLTTQLPVANLRDFVIRDKLPAGIRCVEDGPEVNMGPTGPHSDAGFSPPTNVTPQCNAAGDEIVWDFGDRALTMSAGITRFDFVIDFVARVENVATNSDDLPTQLINGGGTASGGTDVTASYVNESGGAVVLEFDSVTVRVQEPKILLGKSFAVANSNAGDELVVTVTAENNGSAPAYNLQVLDDLTLTDMTYINDSMAGADAPDDDGVAADSKMPIFSWLPTNADYEIPDSGASTKTFTFRVRVDITAQPLEELDNIIQAKWDSLPGQTTALNASGLIGTDGSPTGLRNGVLPNDPGDTLNDYETTATASTTVLPLTLNKNDLNPAIFPTIGAHKNFAIVITLPEGTTNDLVVTDALNFSGLSYVLSRNASYDISYTFNDIVSINGAGAAEAAFRGATILPSPTLPVDADADTITWDIGTVVTAEETDPGAGAVNPSITINYYARVNNDTDTDATDTLQNSATVTYDNGEDATTETLNATTAVQTVVEPLLEFVSPAGAGVTVTNQTVGKATTDLPDSGDTLEYQITLINNGTSEAFDTNIIATLPATGELAFDDSIPSSPTATVNGVAVPLFNPVPAGGLSGPLIWGKNNGDNTLDVPVGETLVLTYRVIVQTITEPNTALATTVTADWTSLEDNDPGLLFERTGDGCPTIAAPDDYCTTESETINTIDDNSIVKSIISDTYNVASLSTALDSTVRIGDTVTYRLAVNIQEGTTESVEIVDALPAGMAFVDVVSINGDTTASYDPPGSGSGSNFSYSIPVGNVPAAGDTLALNWNFGTISNDAAGDATTDTIIIEYRARVVDNETSTIAQNPTTTLTNTADLNYIDGNDAPSPDPAATPRLRSTADLTVLQPEMDALSKLDRDGVPVSGDPVDVASDTMNFRLHSCNTTGLAPAYGLMITDNLPTELNHTTIVGPVNGALRPDVLIDGVLATEGAANDYVYTPPATRGGDMLFVFNTPIDPTECVDIEFDIGFYTDFGFGSWSNIVTVDEYYSLPPANAQLYGPLAPVQFDMNNPATASVPPEKTMIQPAPALPEATIGDEIIYQIKVPATPFGAIMYDVNITDTLDNSLIYLSASDISANSFAITDNTVLPITAGTAIDLVIDQIPAGQQAIIEVRARVDNNSDAIASVNFQNVTNYQYAMTDGATPLVNGGSDNTASTLTIIEPTVTVGKTVENITSPTLAPDAGDILRYTITMAASGGVAPGDLFSDAFDISITDTLSLGQIYNGNLTVDGLGNTIDPPVPVGDGITTAQTWDWSLADGNADIDIVEGDTVTVTYEVLVLDTVQANQELTNTVNVQWHSRDGPDVNQRDGSGTPALNDYFANPPAASITTADNNTVTKTRVTDTFDNTDNDVRIGDIIEYRLLVSLQEGTHPNTEIVDSLPLGMRFEETVSINGDITSTNIYASADAVPAVPYSHPDIAAPDAADGPTTITWTVGEIVNPGDNTANDDFEIIYRARVLNLALDQIPATQPLNNLVDLNYDTATVRTSQNDTQTVNVLQPNLSVTKTRIPATDTVLDGGEVVIYRVDINNTSGTAPAYDTVLRDIIPFGMRIAGVTTTNVQLVIGGTPQLPALTNFDPVFDPATGTTTWDFDTAIADQYTIPAGETLRIEYQVEADAGIGAGLTLTNEAQVQLYYSFDNGAAPALGVAVPVREIYGPSNTATFDLTTDDATALSKENKDPANLDASIGETFTYTIKVPATLQPTALYDVQILDNLNLSAAELLFVSVEKKGGIGSWTPENIGTVTGELIIADATNGIDIQPNDQAVIEVTVTLRDNSASPPPVNVNGLLFNNTADYVFNAIDNSGNPSSAGIGDASVNMRVVEPDLTLVKTGPATKVSFLAPIPYTLVVENVGDGPAFDTTIIDKLPAVPDNTPLTGGTCNATPINIVVNVFENDGTTVATRSTPLPLVLDTDYNVTYTAAPTCELVITTLSDKARIEATEKLIVTYETTLDVGTQSDAELTNIAGVTRWFSLDTAGAGATDEIREYTSTLTDSATVTVEAPVLDVRKTVTNVTTTQSPGDDATPGDTLSYSIVVTNNGLIDASAVTLTDAIPANATYIADTVTLNGLPVDQPDGGVSPLIAGIDINSSESPAPAAGFISAGEAATITFDVLLNSAITSGTVISNQASVDSPSTGVLLSDDPVAAGATDPTTTTITSAPAFLVQKTSLDITDDPAILLPGDTLRYTLTVKNIGQENSVNSLLSDQIPANTVYVANSTMLNGVVVADPAAGISALAAGMLINAPENTTAGFLRADIDVAADNVATISFEVVVNLSAVNGTVISNQGFFSGEGAGSGAFPQQPSDDPATALVDDPTLDVVGNVPVIDVLKTVVIQIDNGTPGEVDPGDTLRYTITSTNIGAIPATGVVLTDAVPVNSTYVGNSSTLNGNALSDPAANISPLITGVDISSSDLPPPTAGNGTLTAGESAIVTFDVLVDGAATPGTIISNQGFVNSTEVPEEPSDADGNDANGDQPTVVIVGNVQQLAITKQVTVVGGGAAQAGGQLEYVVRVTNIGSVAANNVVITDDLDFPVAGQMTYIAGSGLLNGLPAGISDAGSVVTADYATTYGDLPVAGVAELRFRVLLDAGLNIGDTVSNTGEVNWNGPASPLTATADIDIGGTPGAGSLNGQVWHDADFSNDVGGNEALLQGWRVELSRNNVLLGTVLTDVGGNFQFSGLAPNQPADGAYEVRYFAPGAGANTASMGTTNSIFTDGPQQITDIFVTSGASLQNLNLPRQANGVVYDSILRTPVAGVRLTMINQTSSNQVLSENCFADPKHQNQVTLADGYYKFDLIFGDPSCNVNDEYVIEVLPPATGYIGTTSVIIPPVEPIAGNAKDVPACLSDGTDKIPATASHCENSDSDAQAATSVAPRTSGTDYHLKFTFDNAFSTNQIYNNHIPIDSELDAAVAISKVAGMLNVTRSQLVPYTITFTNTLGVKLFDLSIVDNFPAGFKYVENSARIYGDDGEIITDGSVEPEPTVNGRQLTWSNLTVDVTKKRVIKLLLIVGSGVGEGEYVNTAQAINTFTNDAVSGIASATVKVIPDPSFDCSDIIGKVYDDANMNMYQDEGEQGIAGAQVATARGLRVTTDEHGRFHITCAVVADEVRGSNFIIKLDERTLPSGYRITTENPRVQRATRGKMLKFNFGAAIHRVVRLDLADGVFEKNSTELRPQWRSRIDMLIIELQKDPSILRLSYLGENETESAVDDRLDAIEDLISDRWQELNCCYKLTIEKEVFWRKGNPSDRKTFD